MPPNFDNQPPLGLQGLLAPAPLAGLGAALAGAILLMQANYLAFHTLAEMASIVVAITLATVAWFTFPYSRNGLLAYLGAGYAWVALLDFGHTLTYHGMPPGLGASMDHSIQLWIAARLLEALIWVSAPAFIARRMAPGRWVLALGAAVLGAMLLIYFGSFPTCFIAGQGLTPFKVASEYLIIGLLGLAFYRFCRRRAELAAGLFPYLGLSMGLTALGELAFTLYTDPYGLSNFIGHLFKLLSYWVLLQSIVRIPLQSLLQNAFRAEERTQALTESEARYRQLFEGNRVPMLLIDPAEAGRIVDANAAARAFYGYDLERIRGLRIDAINTLSPQQVAAEMACAKTEQRDHFFFRHRLASGAIRDVEVHSGPIEAEGRQLLYSIIHDITESKRHETRMRLMLETTAEGVWVLGAERRITEVNPALCRMLGYARGQMLGRCPLEFVDAVNGGILKGQMARIPDTDHRSYELALRDAAGANIPCLFHATTLYNENGDEEGAFAFISDLRELYRSRQALEASEARYRSVIETMSEGLVLHATDGQILACNRAAEEILGLSRKQMEGLDSTDPRWRAVHEDGRPFPGETHPVMETLRSGKAQSQVMMGVHKPGGELTWISINSAPVPAVSGKVLAGVVVTITDITAIKQALDDLRARDARLRALNGFASERDGDPDTLIPRVLDQVGKLLGMEFAVVSSRDGRYCNRLYSNCPGGANRIFETDCPVAVRPGATAAIEDAGERVACCTPRITRGYLAASFPMGDGDGTICLSSAERRHFGDEDREFVQLLARWIGAVLERARVDADLRRARDRAEAANQAKSAFLANMSHELRTPLNAVLGYAQILEQDPGLSAAQRSAVAAIGRSGNHLLLLLNDILDLAKIEAGRMEIQNTACELPAFFRTLEQMFAPAAEKKGLSFAIELAADLPATLWLDEKRLRQLAINLLGNAVKFTEHGGVTLRARHASGYLILEVADTGPGIAAAQQEAIFSAFYQYGDDQYKQQGTGLGLKISRNLAQLMGGGLGVESTPGAGSRFYLSIPAEPTAARSDSNPRAPGGDRPEIGGYRRTDGQDAPLRVLVTDDNQDNRNVVEGLLRPLGLETFSAVDGESAVALAAEQPPDAVLMDIVMPGIDGLEATRRILARTETAACPIIALSARAYAEDRERSLKAGCVNHLAKPVQRSELLAALQKALPLTWKKPPAAQAPDAPKAASPLPQQGPPLEALDRIEEALTLGNRRRIREIVEQIRPTVPKTAQRLDTWLNDYDFEAMAQWLQQARSKTD